MAITLKQTDAVVVGMGWTGSILARELTKAGLNVVGLERGAKRMPREDFTIPSVRDDLKYAVRPWAGRSFAYRIISTTTIIAWPSMSAASWSGWRVP
jgi:choline dehydrogenase-like flavoprotein